MSSKSSNTQQAFWIGLGSLFSFGFAMVSSMILSRYFDKGDYGTYRQVLYVYSTLLVVFTLGLPKAFSYYLPRVPLNEAKNLISKITNLFYILGGFFSILLFLFSGQIALFLKNPDLELAIRIFSPVPFLMLPTMGLESILATFRKTQFITIYKVSTEVFKLLCVVLPVVIFKGTYIHAVIGFVVASALTFVVAIYFKFLPVRHEANDKTSISYRAIFTFSFPLLYASLWGTLIRSADQFFISRFFGSEVFAEFSNGSLQLPFVGMVIGAGATVLGPVFSKQIHEEADFKTVTLPLWTSVFEKSVKLLYPLVIFSWFFADIIMVVLYSGIYESSAIYFRIKLVVNLFTMIAYGPLIIAMGATRYYANVHMYSAILLVVLEYVAILLFQSPYAVTVVSVICQIGRILALLIFISRSYNISLLDLFPLKLIAKILIPSIILLYIIRHIVVVTLQLNSIFSLIVAVIAYGITYLIWSYFAKIDNLSIIKPLLFKLNK